MSDVVGNKGKLFYSLDGEDFTEFAGVVSLKPGKPNRAKVDNTDLSSDNKTSLPGTIDYNSLEAEIKYAPAITGTILGWFTGGTQLYFKVELNDQITPSTGNPSSGTYFGYVESFDPFAGVERDKVVTNGITFAVNGFEFDPAT
jgi:hypothetical protein